MQCVTDWSYMQWKEIMTEQHFATWKQNVLECILFVGWFTVYHNLMRLKFIDPMTVLILNMKLEDWVGRLKRFEYTYTIRFAWLYLAVSSGCCSDSAAWAFWASGTQSSGTFLRVPLHLLSVRRLLRRPLRPLQQLMVKLPEQALQGWRRWTEPQTVTREARTGPSWRGSFWSLRCFYPAWLPPHLSRWTNFCPRGPRSEPCASFASCSICWWRPSETFQL